MTKTQIRRGVWETNSSSTHSISLHATDATFTDILRDLEVEKAPYSYKEEMFYDVKTFHLCPIPQPEDNEETVAIVKVRSKGARISLLYNIILDCIYTIMKNEMGLGYSSRMPYHKVRSKLMNHPIGKKAWDIILEKTGGAVDESEELMDRDCFPIICYMTSELFDKALDSEQDLRNVVDVVFDEDKSIVLSNIPYQWSSNPIFEEI